MKTAKKAIKTRMTKKEKIKKAESLGFEASKNGKDFIPALDGKLIDLLKDLFPGESIRILEAWQDGFIRNNLADNS